MNESIEAQLREIASRSRPANPDFEAMWARIEERSASAAVPEESGRRASRPRRWTMAAGAVLCLAVAVPVFAEPSSLGWSWSFLTERAAKSLAVGDGVRIDRTVGSGGIDFRLLGAVSDDLRIDLLFELSGGAIAADDTAVFGSVDWTDDRGGRYDAYAIFTAGQDGKRSGLLETGEPMPAGERTYMLNVRDLVFYREAVAPVALAPAGKSGQTARIGAGGIDDATIESIVRDGDVYTVRYRLTASGMHADTSNNPQLVLRAADGAAFKPTISTVLPPPADNAILRQDTYKLSDAQLAGAAFAFARLEESGRVSGEWSFSFQADGKKAEQAIYRRALDPAAAANDSGMKLKELAVTPLEIRVAYDDPITGGGGWPYRHYEKAELLLNGEEIEGGMMAPETGSRYLRFMSPEWYRDWSGVPMQLRLSALETQARADDDQLLTLSAPSDAKQSVEAVVGGFPVRFTYYKDVADLIVESEWLSDTEGGITQTYLLENGKRAFAELHPDPPGGNGTNRKIERYRNVPEGTLQLNPFLYHWTDADKSETIELQ